VFGNCENMNLLFSNLRDCWSQDLKKAEDYILVLLLVITV